MSRAGAGISGDRNPAGAAREACLTALEAAGSDRASAALLFATAEHGPALTEVIDVAADVLGTDPVGASAAGVMIAGDARETGPGVAVLALDGFEAEPFLLHGVAGAESRAGERLSHHLDGELGSDDLVLLLPDPLSLSPAALLRSLEPVLAGAAVVGAGAVEGPGVPPAQWGEGEIANGAVAGLVLRGARPPAIGVTQACRPVSAPRKVTRTDGHWILEIEGRPALDVFREVARGPLAEDLRRAAAFVLIALPDPSDPERSLREGDYRVRNVAGFADGEAGRRAIAVAEPVRSGDLIAFVLREPHGARDDLKRMLGGLSGWSADFALYLDCCARGAALFGVPGLEAAYLQEAFGALPVIGMLGAFEIGPVRGRTELLTYTGVLALCGGESEGPSRPAPDAPSSRESGAGGGKAPGQALA
jgi:small ligand-binding sensory domain FIST